jgi:2-hydroxychromene-2-carboxylate isomerase
MNLTLDFYFDFMSPFAYLAHGELVRIATRYAIPIRYLPIDLPAAKIAAGNTGPANRSIPAKLRYLMTDLNRWAAIRQLPLKFPASLDSQRMNVGTFYAIERNAATTYVSAGFDLGWGQGGDIGADEVLVRLAERMHWLTVDFMRYIENPLAHAGYAECNREAHHRGVFGVPLMMIGEDMWWGNDRLNFLEEFLRERDARGQTT